MIVVISLILIGLSDCAKILVYSPTISPSHMKINSAVADTLAKDGHDVTIIDVQYMVDPSALNYVKLAKRHIFPLRVDSSSASNTKVNMEAVMNYAFKTPTYLEQWSFTKNYQNLFQRICKAHLLDNKILPFLQSQHFDFVISEHVDLCGTAMSYAAGIKQHVLLSTCPLFEHTALTIGLPQSSSSIPAFRHYTKKNALDSFFGRIQNSMDWLVGYIGLRYGSQLVNQAFRDKFGPNFPDVDQLVSKSALTLVNSDEFVDFARQTQFNVVNIGGLGLVQKSKSFDQKDLELFELMESSLKGVIYFSLGSITSTKHLPPNFMPNLIKTFELFKDYQFIVKVDANSDYLATSFNSTAGNLHFVQWAPQIQILNHPKTRLFITHAGYSSVLESGYAGVPLLCLPFFIDQYRNAELVEHNKWGRVFEKREILSRTDTLKEAIEDLLSNKDYSKNASRLRKILTNRPQTAEQRLNQAVKLLELADFKLPELLPESSRMSFLARHNYDILLLLSFSLFILGQILLILMYKFLFSLIVQRSNFKLLTLFRIMKREKVE